MSQPRNLLVIMSDEHQAAALGAAGHPLAQTPHLDRLARRGLRFTNAVTPSPICVPARAAFASGDYVHRTGHWDNAMPYTGRPPGWGHALQAAGIRVESIGKLHYRAADDPNGFDIEHIPMMVAGGVGMVWASIRGEEERWAPEGRMLGAEIGPGESAYTRYDSAVVDETRAWLRDARAHEAPWCLFVGLVAPHFPLVAPPAFYDLYAAAPLPGRKLHPADGHPRHPWVEKQNAYLDSEGRFAGPEERDRAIRAYFGLCSWLDHNVGQILAALEEAGLSPETAVVYTSDHGDNVGARGLWGKSNMYREAVGVPLILAAPGGPVGEVQTPVSLLDLSATIADHFGASLSPGRPGRSLFDVAARPDPDRIVFSEYHAAGAVSGAFMVQSTRAKYIHYEGFAPELFDLVEDPGENRDLAGDPAYAALEAEMRDALHAICNPAAVDAQAHRDQAALVARLGGREAVRTLGAPGATPPPAS
ncbi:MAG: sulfatase-like hydrolase/transferase [Pseudomonadota bacterium]